MTRTYRLDEIDCANCARKLQDALCRLDGVGSARVNFLTQKLVLTAADDAFADVERRAIALVADVEPDCKVLR